MQPDDPKSEFKQPEQTAYYSAPHQPATDEVVPIGGVTPVAEAEPVGDEPVSPSTEPEENATQPVPSTEPVQWQAAEYLQQKKNPMWFVVFGLIVVILIAGAIFLQAWTFVVLIPVMAVALFLYAHRPPQQIDYVLSEKGLYINHVLHPFAEFKGFGVIHDGHEYSVVLIPVRRFRPGVTIYFPEASGEAIVDLLGVRLPMQELHLDAVDRVVRALRI
ncbi:MAG: hypothetical protein ABJA64_01940 [Candidatus Saccharibacteria bacterium]